jgi:hypothetical protein
MYVTACIDVSFNQRDSMKDTRNSFSASLKLPCDAFFSEEVRDEFQRELDEDSRRHAFCTVKRCGAGGVRAHCSGAGQPEGGGRVYVHLEHA